MVQNRTELFNNRLAQIAHFYQQGDVTLGYRRLMDAALDTEDKTVFDAIATHCDWLQQTVPSDAEHWQKASELIEKIKGAGLKSQKQLGENIISAKGVGKTYSNGNFSLGPVDVSLKRGELLGLVGENGNGKTTLLRILAQELSHDKGSIDYHLVNTQNQYDLRSQLAYIPQRTPKWQGTLKENLKFTLSCYGIHGAFNESKVLMIIARLGLWQFKDLKWSELSSGYKMRFELARTFLRCPDILLLDEPLANLDVLAQQTILEDLKTMANLLSAPMAVVLSSQQLYEVEKVSDKVLFLKNGRPLWQDKNQTITDQGSEQTTLNELVIEIDCNVDRDILQQTLAALGLQKLQYNGGTYIAHFGAAVSMAQILATLGNSPVEVLYIRDISKSTRRFFVQ